MKRKLKRELNERKTGKEKKKEGLRIGAIAVSAIVILVVVLGAAFLAAWFMEPRDNSDGNEDYWENMVVKVIDGDTLKLASGEIVRLICVDTHENGEEGYENATNFLFSLVYMNKVRLEGDVQDKDEYGRVLRYVYVTGDDGKEIFVNREIVKKGYGSVFRYGNDTKRCDEMPE